jgi:hypothetical protein
MQRILTHFLESTQNPEYFGTYAGVELPRIHCALTSLQAFQKVKWECLHTLRIFCGETKTIKINSIEIVWEVVSKAGVAPSTLLKDDELVHIHLDSLLRRNGLGHLRVYYTEKPVTPATVSEKSLQRVDTSSNPPPYSEKSTGN